MNHDCIGSLGSIPNEPKRLEEFRSKISYEQRQHYGFTVGQIVYMDNPSGSKLQTGNRKIQCHFVGPLAIYKCITPNQFLLRSLDGVLYTMIVEEARLNPGLIPTHKGPVRTLCELMNAAKIAYRPNTAAMHCYLRISSNKFLLKIMLTIFRQPSNCL